MARPDAAQRRALMRLRPAKVRSALKRRWFEYWVPRTPLREMAGLVAMGTSYGGWILPGGLIDSSWVCYLIGAGGDIAVDLALVHDYGATARCFDAVAEFVELAERDAAGAAGFSAHHAAVATRDGPIRMQVSHDPNSHSVSAAGLYDSHDFLELPGRTIASLMRELGDDRVDLFKLDIEGSEYEVLPSLDLREMGVKVFAVQLHHTGSVAQARRLIAGLKAQEYEPVACRPAVKITFVRRDLIPGPGPS